MAIIGAHDVLIWGLQKCYNRVHRGAIMESPDLLV